MRDSNRNFTPTNNSFYLQLIQNDVQAFKPLVAEILSTESQVSGLWCQQIYIFACVSWEERYTSEGAEDWNHQLWKPPLPPVGLNPTTPAAPSARLGIASMLIDYTIVPSRCPHGNGKDKSQEETASIRNDSGGLIIKKSRLSVHDTKYYLLSTIWRKTGNTAESIYLYASWGRQN